MKPQSLSRMIVFLLPVLFLLLLPPVTFAQKGSDSGGALEKSAQAEEFDKKALEKLQKLTPREVEELDKRLAEAMTFFYDREYARALPIFRDISDRVETMDIMFWVASCAAKAGETDAATDKFQQMLAVDPNLHRVRLELATVYFGLGRYDDARRELNTVLESKPPEAVKQNIEKLLAAIDERTKRLYVNIRGSVGIQRDSNVSAGPDNAFIVIPENRGTLGPLTETQQSVPDWVTVFSASGNALYDFGDRGSWMWNNTASFYQTHNSEHYQFDYTQMRVSTGPWLVGPQSVLKLPVGYAENVYEHEHLYDSWDLNPSFEWFFTPNFSLQGSFSYMRDTYFYSSVVVDDKTGQDAITRIWELNPNFYFNNRRDILSFYVSTENSNAKSTVYTYDAFNLAASYFKSFNWSNWDMEFYARYKWTKKDYEEPAILWPPEYDRRDKRHNFYLVLSRNISKNLFASLSYNLIYNDSNTELYEYTKSVYGFNVGFKF